MHRPDRRASPYRPETGPVTISVEKFEALLPQALNRATGAKPKQDIFFLIRTHLLPLRNNNFGASSSCRNSTPCLQCSFLVFSSRRATVRSSTSLLPRWSSSRTGRIGPRRRRRNMKVRELRTSEMKLRRLISRPKNDKSMTFANCCGQHRSQSKGLCVFKSWKAQQTSGAVPRCTFKLPRV